MSSGKYLRNVAVAISWAAITVSAYAVPVVLETTKLLPSDSGTSGFGFARSMDVSGDTLVVGAPSSEAVYVFSRSDNGTPNDFSDDTWIEDQKLLASDSALNKTFGDSVSVDGDIMVVGSPAWLPNPFFPGAAYVFRRGASGWIEEQRLPAPSGIAGDAFGASVSVSGNRVAIGRPISPQGIGRTHVFQYDGTAWVLETILTADVPTSEDLFGISVGLSGDVLAVGARSDDDVALEAGAAYVFRRGIGGWVRETKITPPELGAFAFFGESISIDVDSLIVGSQRGAWVYRFRTSGWFREAAFVSPDGSTANRFGSAVDILGDVAVVGALDADDACPTAMSCNSGSAFLFERIGARWFSTAKLLASDAEMSDLLGASVALHSNFAMVGSGVGPVPNAAYFFDLQAIGPPIPAIPAVSAGGLFALVVALVGVAAVFLRRRCVASERASANATNRNLT